jgi:MFS family permease
MESNNSISSFHVIRHILTKNYAFSFLAFFLFLSAFHSLTPTLPLYLAKLGSREREIGILVGIIGVASLVSRFLVGRLILQFSEKRIMMGGAAIFTLSFIALIVFRPFWPYFILRLLQGIGFASLDTAAIAFAIRIIPEAYRARGIGYFLLATSLASAVASASSVFIANEFGFTILLLTSASLAFCAFLFSWLLREDKMPAAAKPAEYSAHFVEPRIIAPAIVSFLFFFSWAGIAAFFPLYAVECGVSNPGIFFSANAVMIIIVRSFGAKALDIYPREKIISTFLCVAAAGMIVLSFSHTLAMFILVGAIMGSTLAFLIPVTLSYALEYAGSSDGSAVATYQASMDLGMALGPVTMGIIIPFTGYRILFLFVAFVYLTDWAYFQFFHRTRGRGRRNIQ